MSRPFSSRSSFSPTSAVRVNGKIRAREVRVIGVDGQQHGVLQLADAINLARSNGVDLVEIAATANPPVCRLVDFGKFFYEQAKKEKEARARKHQHANKVKEIQLNPQIDPHDFGVKLSHAIDFLCEDMKVKVTLRFRGREMAHKEFGFQQVEKFTKEIEIFGHPDFAAKLVGKGITVMFSPLPRNKRARNPRQDAIDREKKLGARDEGEEAELHSMPSHVQHLDQIAPKPPPAAFLNNPFVKMDVDSRQDEEPSQDAASGS